MHPSTSAKTRACIGLQDIANKAASADAVPHRQAPGRQQSLTEPPAARPAPRREHAAPPERRCTPCAPALPDGPVSAQVLCFFSCPGEQCGSSVLHEQLMRWQPIHSSPGHLHQTDEQAHLFSGGQRGGEQQGAQRARLHVQAINLLACLLDSSTKSTNKQVHLFSGGQRGGEQQGAQRARLHVQAADRGARAQALQLQAPLALAVQVAPHLPQRPAATEALNAADHFASLSLPNKLQRWCSMLHDCAGQVE